MNDPKYPTAADEEKMRRSLERQCAEIGRILTQGLAADNPGERVGFCFLMFDFGERGMLAYCSNAEREDMIKALAECRSKLIEGRQ